MSHVSRHKLQNSGWIFFRKMVTWKWASSFCLRTPCSLFTFWNDFIQLQTKTRKTTAVLITWTKYGGRSSLFLDFGKDLWEYLNGYKQKSGRLQGKLYQTSKRNGSSNKRQKSERTKASNRMKKGNEWLKELKHQTGWGREKRDTLQHFLAHNNPWMTCTHSSSLKHQCCIKFCNVKHMRNI